MAGKKSIEPGHKVVIGDDDNATVLDDLVEENGVYQSGMAPLAADQGANTSGTVSEAAQDKYATVPEPVHTAVILVAEMYAVNAAEGAEGKGAYKSETFDDYSYTLADTTAKIDNLLLGPLLDDYIIKGPRNGVTMRLRKL